MIRYDGNRENDWEDRGAADTESARAKAMGLSSHGRTAPQLDLNNANQSRGMQIGGLGLMQAQANGTAPSSAQITSQRANQRAAQAAGSASLGNKTAGGGGLAALNKANPMASGAALESNAKGADARAAEISQGQGQFAKGANYTQGQDIGSASTNANLEGQQRALNERRQQGFEERSYETQKMQQEIDRANEQERLRRAKEQAERNQDDSDDAKGWIGTGLKVGSTVLSWFSDENTKKNITPMGSLGRFGKR